MMKRSLPSSRKFFQIGFNRCGTTSIHRFFLENGIPSIHHDYGRLAIMMESNLRNGRPVLSGYEQFDAFSDMEMLRPPIHVEAYKFYREIAQQVPEALFILNVRNVDRWVESRLRLKMDREGRIEKAMSDVYPGVELPEFPSSPWHRRGLYAEFYQKAHGLAGIPEVIEHWKADWEEHVKQVKEYIPGERLLVFDIESDSPLALCRFAGLDVSAALHFRQENISLGTIGRFLSYWTPDPVLKATPRGLKRAARRLLSKRRSR